MPRLREFGIGFKKIAHGRGGSRDMKYVKNNNALKEEPLFKERLERNVLDITEHVEDVLRVTLIFNALTYE